jgi:hypothetical protein
MLFYLSIALTAASLLLIALRPKQGILFTLMAKPIIDTTWGEVFFGIKLLYIMGVGVPVLVFIHAIFNKEEDRLSEMPLFWFWLTYISWNFITSQIITYQSGMKGLDIFFRVLNGFLGFYWFQRYFREKEDLNKLLLAMLVAGMFPIGVGVFQFVTGYTWKAWVAEGGMRNIGLYHDQATLKYYFFQTVAALLLYISYFGNKGKVRKVMLSAYFVLCVPVLYKLYVKSGNVAFGLWLLIWTGLQKRFLLLGLIVFSAVLLNTVSGNRLLGDILDTYQKEIGVIRGDVELERSFAGRWFRWKAWFNEWQSAGILVKAFGTGKTGSGAHNDYIFVVTRSGVVGLLSYLLLLGSIGVSMAFSLLRRMTPLKVLSLMIFCLWLVEAIGLVPSGYPSFQWFAWGFIGLSLRLDRDGSSWVHAFENKVSPAMQHGNRKLYPLEAGLHKALP